MRNEQGMPWWRQVNNPKLISCQDFMDIYDSKIVAFMEELVWEGKAYETAPVERFILKLAHDRKVTLLDPEDFDFDHNITVIWENEEWGLS